MNSIVETKTYNILAQNLPAFQAKMETYKKKANKLGLDAPSYAVGEYLPQIYNYSRNEISRHASYEVQVTGNFPKLPNWTFLGKIEHTEHGNILKSVVENQPIPEAVYRTSKSNCDHCQTNRGRNVTYIVAQENMTMQIGSACVKDFTGGVSPDALAYEAEFVNEMALFERDLDSKSSGKNEIEINTFMAYCVAVVESTGFYVSKAKSQEMKHPTTAEQAKDLMNNVRDKKSGYTPATPKQYETALAMLEWARALEGKSSFEQNIKVVAHKTILKQKDLGLVASITVAYTKHHDMIKKQKEEVKKNEETPGEFVGEIKKRQFFTLTIKKILTFENEFGVSQLYLFEDEKGNHLTWNSSGCPHLPVEHKLEGGKSYWTSGNISEGNTYVVKATVKGYKTYKGKNQTTLTRVSFEPIQNESQAEQAV